MREITDFEPDYSGSYFLPRETPPRHVWPALDGWLAAHLECPEAIEKVDPNRAAGAFLELLEKLRVGFLQLKPFPSSSSNK
jgi:hypothetical protein